VREQLVDPRGRVSLDAEENVGEVGDGVDAVYLAGGDERVEAGQVLAGVIRAHEEEVLAPERGDAERALGDIVVDPEGAGRWGRA